MKKSLLIAAVAAFAPVAMMAQAAELGKIYVVPVDAAGKLPAAVEGGYEGMVEMTGGSVAGGMSAKEVAINGAGFIFYAAGTSESGGAAATTYGLPIWAVRPAIIGMENPLNITGGYAPVPVGVYDITFYQLPGYNYFNVVRSDEPTVVDYPSQVYIVSQNGSQIAVPGADGVYSDDLVLPASFRVSYEPDYDLKAAIYGPAAGTTLVNDEELPLALRENTGAVISYAADGGLKSGDKVTVTINILPGSESILVKKIKTTAISDIEADGDAPAVYYDLGGRALSGTPSAPGVYIVRRGASVSKVAVGVL
ncbi:MAG: hypothetical protein JFR38_00485 [Muribaculaceae bacterium]|nr:hypothetical protein [Muribaculaceae bacterium]